MLQLSYNSLLLTLPLTLLMLIITILLVFRYSIRYIIFTENFFILTFATIFCLIFKIKHLYYYDTLFFSFTNIDLIFLSLIFLSICFTCFFMFNNIFIMEEIIILVSLLFIAIFAISANNFISLFICFESLNICFFILILSSTNDMRSIEAAIQYIYISMIASLIFLLGITFIYLTWMSFSYNDLILYFLYTPTQDIDVEMFVGFCLVIITFFIKLGVFPFYNWMVVVYSKLTLKPLMVVSCLMKFIFSLILLKIVTTFSIDLRFLLFIGAVGSLIVGCFYLLVEEKTKSYIAFLSLISTGFMLLFWCSINTDFLYVFTYVYITIQAFNFVFFFGFLSFLQLKKDLPISIRFLRNYGEIHFGCLIFFIFTLFSLIGIPPFPGFFPKIAMLFYLFANANYILLVLFIIFTLILSFCILRMMIVISKNQYQTGLLVIFQSFKAYVWISLYVLFTGVTVIINYNIINILQ